MPIGVVESQLREDDEDVIPEFGQLVGEALRGGADVSVICVEEPKSLGFPF